MPNDERRTPPDLFKALDDAFHFTVDAASTDENALVAKHWTKDDDGLSQCWNNEIVFCNPPYSRGSLLHWVEKAVKSHATTIMLLPGDSSTLASQYVLERVTAVLFVRGRLMFDNETAGAKFPSWIVLFHGTRRDVMRLRNLNLGVVL